jgi:hypothetical protein
MVSAWSSIRGRPFLARCPMVIIVAHTIGNEASQAYNRTTMRERRRPTMQAWADYVCGGSAANVIDIKRGAA